MLQFLAFYFAASTIVCVTSEACSNQQTGNVVHQVAQTNCSCTTANTGTLRYYDNELQICDGDRYVNVVDGFHEFGSKTKPATTCNEIAVKHSDAKSGMYYLHAGGAVIKAYCYMEEICGSKGWTMIMKINGAKSTFHYASPYWTNKATYNIAGASGGLDDQETKLQTYSYLSFSSLCLGFKSENGTNWMSLPYAASSLHSLIADGEYKNTSSGRDAWKSLIPGSSLHTKCHKEGFNVRVGFGTMVRIGVLASSTEMCQTPASRIGFGTGGNECGQDDSNTAGNEARCGADDGDQSIRGMGYIFARTQEDIISKDTSVVQPLVDTSVGSLRNPVPSCLYIKTTIGNATNGLYYLNLTGNATAVYCHMQSICNKTGWTLIMKIDGNKPTFHYTSSYWTNKITYNTSAASGGLDNQETKLETYSEFPFQDLCLGMKTNDVTNWMSLKYPADSLYSLIIQENMIKTNQGLNAWKDLIPGSSLQTRCLLEGFNVNSQDGAMARIGIVGNQENHCRSADSRIGFGTGGKRCGQDDSNSAGNEARCSPDNGVKSIKSFGYIFARDSE